MDTTSDPRWLRFRKKLKLLAEGASEYCGLPIPLEGESLTIEPRHPAASLYAEKLDSYNEHPKEPDDDSAYEFVNSFYSTKYRSTIVIFKEDGKLNWGLDPAVHHLRQDMGTMGCSDAWTVEAEHRAQLTLQDLISPKQFHHYYMTGMFIESSPRSNVFYIFRRLKPTVAIKEQKGEMKILASLCLHPIGYYDDTWAGAMVPTDDVIAHLLMMRGDEHMFWKRSNQHRPYRPEAGL